MLADEIGDTPAERPLRHLELICDRLGRDRSGRTTQDLDNLKQAFGAAHE